MDTKIDVIIFSTTIQYKTVELVPHMPWTSLHVAATRRSSSLLALIKALQNQTVLSKSLK